MEAALLAAIAATPGDMAPRLVYADWLLANGDERGELIIFDDADRRGHFQRFVDDHALRRLLDLSARYGFPRFSSDPEDALLPFEAEIYREGDREYRIQQQASRLIAHDADERFTKYPNAMDEVLWRREFTDREIEVFTSIVSRAIRLGRPIDEIEIPYGEAIEDLARLAPRPTQAHPLFGVVDYERWCKIWKRWFRRP